MLLRVHDTTSKTMKVLASKTIETTCMETWTFAAVAESGSGNSNTAENNSVHKIEKNNSQISKSLLVFQLFGPLTFIKKTKEVQKSIRLTPCTRVLRFQR